MTAALVSPALPTLANTDRSRAAVRAVLAAMAMVVTDAAMMNVALPTFADAFGVSAARSVQVVSVYQIAVVMFLLPCAAVGEAIGLRKVFCCGLATFVAASTLAASAGSFQWLVAARFAQGVGAAAVMALGIALLRQALPEATLTKAIGWNAVTVALCSAAGPTAAAIVLTLADWPTLFMVHLPFAALALANSRALPAPRRADTAPDLLGIGIGATAFGALFVGLSAFATGPALASMLVAGSAICFWLEARRARNRQLPVIRVDLLKLRSFRRSIVASVCCFVAQTAGLLAVPFYLHDALA
ncbi:MAG TPA: MFS transporter, partial [Sphingomicrobium sp.]|nr:MFS transporter [Sphingomicrobium sp.]